jgi:plasmid stabilization system protein ParE
MTIIYNPTFDKEIIDIVDYIALDKPSASINFALELEKLILNIPYFPFKYKPSFTLMIKILEI